MTSLAIWIDADDYAASWTTFKAKMNDYHSFGWLFSKLFPQGNFTMDLTLTINDGRIHSTLYEKDPNLITFTFRCISAHLPGRLLGLIHGLVFHIITLCTNPFDVKVKLNASFIHLLHHGHDDDEIRTVYKAAITNPRQYEGITRVTSIDNIKIPFCME
jgi:hypothetical protein